MFAKNKIKKYKGVTFLELMVVIAIIGIMTAVALVSLQPAKDDARLKAAQGEVAASIRLAQSYALQGKAQAGAKPCGYGFRFDPTDSNKQKYEIFYKVANTGKDCSDPNYTSFNTVEGYSLKNGVFLNAPVFANTEIYYAIPFGTMYGSNGSPFLNTTLKVKYLTVEKNISITTGGQVIEN
jgi:type II secretion system protein H